MKTFLRTLQAQGRAKGHVSVFGLFTLGLLLALSPKAKAAMSGTYTVCATGCNYTTVKGAVSALNTQGVSGPVIVNIFGGNYNENVTLNNVTGASAANTITFNGNGNGTSAAGTNGSGPTRMYYSGSTVFYLSSSKYVTVQNMIIEQTSTSPYALYAYYTNSCTINNCVLRAPIGSSGTYVVYDYYNTNLNFSNNYIRGGYYAMYTYGSSSSTIYGGSTYKKNTLTQQYYMGFYAYYNYNNTYDGNYLDSFNYTYCYPVYAYYGRGDTWKNNRIGTGGTASAFYYGMGIISYPNYYGTTLPYTFVNNMVNISGSSYRAAYFYGYYAANVYIRHNTFYSAASSYGVMAYSYYTGGLEMTNNIFYDASGPAMYYYRYSATTDKLDGNDYYNAAGGVLLYYGTGTAYNTLATYKAAALSNGYGANEQSMKPTFKSVSDLHLDQTTVAPSGINIGVAADIDGDARCTLFPTAGADESNFGKSKPSVKIAGGTTLYAGTPTTFYNSAKAGEPKVHAWYIDKTQVSTSLNLTTTSLTLGTHTIKLVTTACAGTDSAKMVVSVVNPTVVPATDFIADKNSIKQGDVVTLTDLSANGPNKWLWRISPTYGMANGTSAAAYKFVNGTDSTKYITQVQFNVPGKYRVCLTAANAVGAGNTECKTAYIEVIASYNFANNVTIHDTKGYLYDDGGNNGNYSYSSTMRHMVLDPCADSVYIVFNSFTTYCGYDFLRMYEGTDNSGKALHSKCTSTMGYSTGYSGGNGITSCYGTAPGCYPNQTKMDTIKAKGKVYLEFETNYGSGNTGWEMYWWSKPKSQAKPKASFTSSADSVCINSGISFKSTSVGADMTLRYELNNDFSDDDYDGATASWAFQDTGWHKVYLLASNCGGTDTATRRVYVKPAVKPTANFSALNTKPTTNDVVQLSTANMKTCVSSFQWTIVKKYSYKTGTTPTVIYVSGTKGSANPSVNLPDTGCWDVTLKVTSTDGTNTYTDTKFQGCFFNVKGSYCTPSVSTIISDIGISKVTLKDIANSTSQGITDYQNFTPSLSTTLEIGSPYKLSVERNTNSNKATRSVFIDWNGDGDFDDAQEHYADDINNTSLVWNTTVKVPSFATVGATIMRIAINQGNYTNKACGQNEFGEYEDYRIYISPDITRPVISLNGAKDTMAATDTVYIEQGHAYKDKGARANDNVDGNITARLAAPVQSPVFNKLVPGTYKFTYTIADAAGNNASPKTRIVIVTPDKTAPVITVAGPDTTTVEVGNTVVIPAWIDAQDSVSGDVTSWETITNPVNAGVIGWYTVTYSDTDENGNTALTRRYIHIVDTIAPAIQLSGKDTVYTEVGNSYADQGITATDNYNKPSELALDSASTVNTSKLGTYVYTYYVKDASGNKSRTVTRTVIVRDTQKPVVALKGNFKGDWEVNTQYTDPGATATDNYWKNLKMDTMGTFYKAFPTGMPNKLGTYTIIYRFADGSGNKDSVVRTLNVIDDIAPVITLKGPATITACRWRTYTDSGYVVNDNFWTGSKIKVSVQGTFSGFSTNLEGLFSFRYKAVDGSNNVGYSAERYVLVSSKGACISGINDPDAIAKQISVFPNPSNGRFTVQANLSTTQKVKIAVLDMYGREIAVVNNGVLNNNQFEVDLSAQAAGIYTISIVMDNVIVSKQIMIAR